MKRLLFFLLLLWPAWAEFTWPPEAVPVRVNGELVDAFWRDGVPYVRRDKTVHIFHVRDGPEELNLEVVLHEQHFAIRQNTDGSIDAKKAITIDEVHPSADDSHYYFPSSYSSGGSSGGRVYVKGYYRKDGTYVSPHTRSKPR